MILRSTCLSRKPARFKTMTGLTVALFDELVWDLRPALAQAHYAAQERPDRQRAVGGGPAAAQAARPGGSAGGQSV